jgi:hypothetical protein
MTRLFMLRYGKGGAPVKDEDGSIMYFGNKQDAKQTRDMFGGDTVVSYGIDHKLYKGV